MDNPKHLLDLKHAAARVCEDRGIDPEKKFPGLKRDVPQLLPDTPAAAMMAWLSKSKPLVVKPWGVQLVDHARRDVGVTEHPAGSNSGPRIDAALAFAGVPLSLPAAAKPWCAAMVSLWLHEMGYQGPWPANKAYVPSWEALAHAKGLGIALSAAQAGDLVTFQFDTDPEGDHIGLVVGPPTNGLLHTIEGNTSPDDAGSQSNGGMVCARLRPVRLVHRIIRLPRP